MTRLYVICEGQTEAAFVQDLLTPHFRLIGLHVTPTLIGTAGQKGGDVSYARLLASLKPLLLGGHKPYCTTFIDFYGLRAQFPGKSDAATQSTISDKANTIYGKLRCELETEIDAYPLKRFIPYVQMYEFEGLLFSHPLRLANGIYESQLGRSLTEIRSRFDTPEHINDHPQTAPSKRIRDLFPEYDKESMGTLAALAIGLDTIRQACPLFDAWLRQLEKLPPLPA